MELVACHWSLGPPFSGPHTSEREKLIGNISRIIVFSRYCIMHGHAYAEVLHTNYTSAALVPLRSPG